MGQKVHPVLFRSNYRKVDPSTSSISPPQNSYFSHLLVQEIESKKFLYFLLRSRGIFLRSCSITKTPGKLSVCLDLYFTSLFLKPSKMSWVKSFFKNMKKEHSLFKKIKEVKGFVETYEASSDTKNRKLKYFSKNKSKNLEKKESKLSFSRKTLKVYKSRKLDDFEVLYSRRLFYALCYQKKKELFLDKKDDTESVFSVSQVHLKPGYNLVKTNMSKLSGFFSLRKLKYSFYSLSLRKFLSSREKSQSLLELNKFLCQSLQAYYGVEEVSVKLASAQMLILPFLKRHKKIFVKKLFAFQRNRSLKKYFHETVELFYFLHVCFSKGNAFLLAKFIAYMLEKNRKQLIIVRFLKKCVQCFFKGFSKTSRKGSAKKKKNFSLEKSLKYSSNSFLAINGMRILIKGRLNKRRRTKKFLLSSGQFSLQTLDTCIDYHQTHATTIYGSFGIKVWISKKN